MRNNLPVIVLSCFHEEVETSRSYLVANYFADKGKDLVVLYNRYSHSNKNKRSISHEGYIGLDTPGYSSNTSVKRLLSHLIFALKAGFEIRRINSDLIYIVSPPNIVAYIAMMMARRNVKIIVDTIDTWPEVFENLSMNALWRYVYGPYSWMVKCMRNTIYRKANLLWFSSNFFKNMVGNLYPSKSFTLLLSKRKAPGVNNFDLSEDLSIAYLGNLGSSYDFESLIKIVCALSRSRPVHVHIIGLGERESWLLTELQRAGAVVYFHGPIYCEEEKSKILSKCWFGYNAFRDSIKVGLSYKSIDYLSYGLPLLNSLPGDTRSFVEIEDCGVNFQGSKLHLVIGILRNISCGDVALMKHRARKVYIENFQWSAFVKRLDYLLERL